MGLNIKRAIKQQGMEVREVAAKMGITPTALAQHINGKIYKGRRIPANPSLATLQRIANIIGVDIAELFDPPNGNEIGETGNKNICPHCGKEIHIIIT